MTGKNELVVNWGVILNALFSLLICIIVQLYVVVVWFCYFLHELSIPFGVPIFHDHQGWCYHLWRWVIIVLVLSNSGTVETVSLRLSLWAALRFSNFYHISFIAIVSMHPLRAFSWMSVPAVLVFPFPPRPLWLITRTPCQVYMGIIITSVPLCWIMIMCHQIFPPCNIFPHWIHWGAIFFTIFHRKGV